MDITNITRLHTKEHEPLTRKSMKHLFNKLVLKTETYAVNSYCQTINIHLFVLALDNASITRNRIDVVITLTRMLRVKLPC